LYSIKKFNGSLTEVKSIVRIPFGYQIFWS